jgi:hypothetical protein
LLALVWGLTSVVIGAVPFLLLMIRNYEYYSQYFLTKNYLIQTSTSFLSAVLFILSITVFIKLYGLKLWSILLSVAVPSILIHSVYYTVAFLLEGKFDYKITGLVGLAVHILFFSIAVYFGLYQYVQSTKKAEMVR